MTIQNEKSSFEGYITFLFIIANETYTKRTREHSKTNHYLSYFVCKFYFENNSFPFLKTKIPRQTIYDILKKYNVHKTTTFLSKSGRPPKISDKEVQLLVKAVNNKTGIIQRQLGR